MPPPPSQPESPLSAAPDALALVSSEFVARAKASGLLTFPPALEGYRSLFRRGVPNSAVSPGPMPLCDVLREESPEGEVVKFTQTVPGVVGGTAATLKTESVLIPMIGKSGRSTYTLCVSSQVGCAMGCTFCETAQMGLIRSLTAAEIVGQWYTATHVLKRTVKNLVFMGMGEPMDNLENVLQAVAVLTDHNGAAVPMSHITVSTVGRVDGMERMKAKLSDTGWHRLNLAVSLNAPNDEVRSRIMPINRAVPMGALREALMAWPIYGGGKLCIEYVLIPGVNDAPEHAREIAEWVRPINSEYQRRTEGTSPRTVLNLIPYNPRRNSPWPAPTEADVDRFLNLLIDAGVFVKRRRTKGRDMMGACGQLGAAEIRKRRLVELTRDGANP